MHAVFRPLAVLALTLLIALPAHALPRQNIVPGGIAMIDLGSAVDERPSVTFGKRPVVVVEQDGRWVAAVGIDLKTKPGSQAITVNERGKTRSVRFVVRGKAYPEQRLTIKNKRKVNPYAQDMDRITSERERKRAAIRVYSDNLPDLDFIQPVKGRFSSAFGLRRFFNDQPRSPHSGLDIAAARGTPIKAPAAGTVVEAGDFFFSGNVAYIDHGQGVISLYAHMNELQVKVGDRIDKGQVIGTVGDTGRVTGPHLHWTVYLNRNKVDPALFLPVDVLPASLR